MTDTVPKTIEEFEEKEYQQYIKFMKSLGVPFPLNKEKFLEVLRTNPIAHKVYHKLFDVCPYSLVDTNKIQLSSSETEKYR